MVWKPDISPDAGEHRVLLKRGVFHDEARENREVPYKIYHPELPDGEKRPLIVWSHGFGGNQDGASFLSRYLASHGYIVAHPTHRGTDSSLWEGKPGHPWDVLRQAKITRTDSLNRFDDIPFLLNSLEQTPELAGMIDFTNIGMSGHSFGAMTTQVMAGMAFPNVEGDLLDLADDRFKAGILYSPVPIPHILDGDEAAEKKVYQSIKLPLFHMTGTQDDSPLENFGFERRLWVFENSSAAERYLKVLQDGDHMVYNGTRGKLEANPLRDVHEEMIKLGALSYWDAMLKNDAAAKTWLEEGGLTNYMGEHGEFSREKAI